LTPPPLLATSYAETHSALLPQQLCQCNAWTIPNPVPNDTSGGGGTADVVVTVRVVAENEAGRFNP